ncbi:MAG: DUF1127 domain-containing protein [Hyphomicrobiaceae bacterium]
MKSATASGAMVPSSEALIKEHEKVQSHVSGAFREVMAQLRRYIDYRRGVDELHACSDRVLHDLSINRCDIERRVWQATYKR